MLLAQDLQAIIFVCLRWEVETEREDCWGGVLSWNCNCADLINLYIDLMQISQVQEKQN